MSTPWHIVRRRCLVQLLLLLCVSLALPEAADASEKLCKTYFKRKQFVEATRCFDGLARTLARPKNKAQRVQKGRWLRNAWLSALRAARMEKKAYKKAFLLEQVVRRIKPYLRHKLYETPNQKRLAESRLSGVTSMIGYARLSVVSGAKKALVEVSGYRFSARGLGSWSQSVRPGRYTVKLTYPGKPSQIKLVEMKSGVPTIARFQPPVPAAKRVVTRAAKRIVVRRLPTPRKMPSPKRTKTGAWVAIGVGAAVMLAGGGLLIASASFQGERSALLQKLEDNQGKIDVQDTLRFSSAAAMANGTMIGGVAGLGAGTIGVIIGIVMLAK